MALILCRQRRCAHTVLASCTYYSFRSDMRSMLSQQEPLCYLIMGDVVHDSTVSGAAVWAVRPCIAKMPC